LPICLAPKPRRGNPDVARQLQTCQVALFAPIFDTMVGELPLTRFNFRQIPHWLALAAVLLQLVVSFGHIHAEDYRFLLRGHSTLEASSAQGSSGGALPTLAPDTGCVICASAQLLGSGVLPDSPFAPIAQQIGTAGQRVPIAFWLTQPRRLLFSTRAPPLV
jgi:hypothetical protein